LAQADQCDEEENQQYGDKTGYDNVVQQKIASRRRMPRHPRQVPSEYLLSGVLYCGKCGAKMSGSCSQAGRYHYYACQSTRAKGKDVCDMRFINQDDIEGFIIDRIKANVLTEANLTELYKIVLDEMDQSRRESAAKLKSIDKQLQALKMRLGRLYDSLETGKLDIDDLAPRIRELKARIEQFETERSQIMENTEKPKPLPLDFATLKYHVRDLADLLKKGSFMEQKSFLQSFIKRIQVNSKLTIDYTIPVNPRGNTPATSESLPIEQNREAFWKRTVRAKTLIIRAHF